MRATTIAAAILLGGLFFNCGVASAYPVGPALSLTELEAAADLVCKAVAVDSEPAEVSPYKALPGFRVLVTRLSIVEVFKGDAELKNMTFVHYAVDDSEQGYNYMPQHYEFEPGKPYILFAKKTERGGHFQMLWENHKAKEDQGLVRAADDKRFGERDLRHVVWTELTTLLKSEHAKDAKYALNQLDQMSGNSYDSVLDFERGKVLDVIEPFIRSKNAELAEQAIQAMGARNPFMSSDLAAGYLASISKGQIPGYATWEVTENEAGRRHWKSLAAVADSDRDAKLRALAIRALGLVRQPQLKDHVLRWIDDGQPSVRQAAAMLLADYPDLADTKTMRRLAKDAEPSVRAGIATAIGFGQLADHLHLLGVLINDSDPRVTSAAALNLLSFPVDSAQMTMQANIDHPEYGCLFVNALAEGNPEPYLEPLAKIVRGKPEPKHWWGGRMPWGVSWEIPFKYAQQRPAEELAQTKWKDVLDALESPQYYGSSEPRDLYALYLQRGMTERAKAFREACRKRLTYDIDYYFKMVDENPDLYRRE